MANTVRITFEGTLDSKGDILLSNGVKIPSNFRVLATSEEVVASTIVPGDIVANEDNTIVGVVTTTGYVMLRNVGNPAVVGRHTTYDVSKIPTLGFRPITLRDFFDAMAYSD